MIGLSLGGQEGYVFKLQFLEISGSTPRSDLQYKYLLTTTENRHIYECRQFPCYEFHPDQKN